MPRYAYAQLRWSEQTQTYVLSPGEQGGKQALSSEWLEQHNSFAFHSRSGMHYTVRKQRVQRGGDYWYAYRRLHGRVVKRYLGKTTDLTLERLEEIAQLLVNETETSSSVLSPLPATNLQTLSIGSPTKGVALLETYPLLRSKLLPPRLPASVLERPRLFALLDRGREGPLTLLSAPAGFGKTTLVSQWIGTRRASADFPPVAWVSLEASENDPVRFWSYLVAACQAFQVDLTPVQHASTGLTPQPPFLPADLVGWLTVLLNALVQAPACGILVLEDYQALIEPVIHETFAFFLDHLPETLHVLIITRTDPPFALASLRARNALVEVRAADLRFSQEETATLFQHLLPFRLDTELLRNLHEQLEGWGVGLQMTKLTLQHSSSIDAQTLALLPSREASFRDYFVTEVLRRQPQEVQQFLLQTSLLPHLTASLCDAVTEQATSQEMLLLLERANVFLERLYDEPRQAGNAVRQWYRYHRLFAEAMRYEARNRLGEDALRALSDRASHWYEQHNLLAEAIEAALAAQSYARTALLLTRFLEERILPGEIREPQTLLRWFKQVPETFFAQRPVLCLGYATTLLLQSANWSPDASSLPLIETLLNTAEQDCRAGQHLSKWGEVLAFRALLVLRQGEMQVAARYAGQALEWLAQTQNIWWGLCATIVATEDIKTGAFHKAREMLQEAYTRLAKTNNVLFRQVATIKLAEVDTELGEIQQAAALYRQALDVVLPAMDANQAPSLAHWRCTALLGYAGLCYEENELQKAAQLLQEVTMLSQKYLFLHHEIHASLLLARLQQAQDQTVVAQQQLADLLERVPASQVELVWDVQTARARLALVQGDHLFLQDWTLLRVAPVDFAQRTEEELLLVRWLRIQGKEAEAFQRLIQLLLTARQAGHVRRVLEIRVEMALSAFIGKRRSEAQQMLHEALLLALPNHPIRVFLDAGEPLAMLLRALLPQCQEPLLLAYMRTLLGAVSTHHSETETPDLAAPLVEPLSPQELRVLRLLAQHRTNAEIAETLVVSINTVRTQVQSIYSKLGVHKRSAASEVARDLHLL